MKTEDLYPELSFEEYLEIRALTSHLKFEEMNIVDSCADYVIDVMEKNDEKE